MSEEAERWKEKYLKSIEQQDKLELRWNARLDLLRRGLVRSTLAAEGADKAVDECMKEMRDIVRKDDMDAGLDALIPRLEKAVLDSEQRREQRVEQMATALSALVAQLLSLPLPREVAKPLKRFAKDLEDRVNQARELPLLLSELSGLQGQALSRLEHPEEAGRRGLLQRLFGSRDAAAPADVPQLPVASADPPKPAAPADVLAGVDDPLPHAPNILPPANEAPRTETPGIADAAVASPPVMPTVEVSPAIAEEPPIPQSPSPAAPPIVSKPEVSEAVAGSRLRESVEPMETVTAAALEPAHHLEPSEAVGVSDVAEPEDTPSQAAQPSELQAVESALLETAEAEALQETNETSASDEESAEHGADEGGTEADTLYALPSSPEPSYSSVATHIEHTLLGLLTDLTLPEHHRPQAESMRLRLEHGLNWYELLPMLDDLAVLMLAITDSGHHEFEQYLKQLNERLESFQANLQAASEDHAGQQTASQALNAQLREHVGDLQSSVLAAADLDSLKTLLETRLEGLLGTLDQHQNQRDKREQDVAPRLQALAGRVATMEQEATGFRAHLEVQRQKALIDTLTGLPNCAAWSERLEHEVDHLHKRPSSLLLGILDLDCFKRINDGYGHLAGDRVLKIVALQLQKRLRSSDFIARFGGEEFVVLLPDTQMADGLAMLERLREAVEHCPFHFKGEPVTITVSMGITTFAPGEQSDLVLKRADQALHRAKDEGRNRIEHS